jgi:hypothetical protein
MSIQVQDLVQAVAEGVLRAVEARGAGEGGPAGPVGLAGLSRGDLISRLLFEVHIRAGGIPGPLATPALAVQAAPVALQPVTATP